MGPVAASPAGRRSATREPLLSVVCQFAVAWCSCGPEPYPDDVADNFKTSCVLSGGTATQCECFFEWFEANVSYDDFAAEEVRLVTGTMSDRLADWYGNAISECS